MEINHNYATNPSSQANGKIDSDFKQNLPGDCALLASIFSLAQTEKGADAIENSIDIIKDNNGKITKYEVTFDGPDETYTVTQKELEEAKKEGERQYSTGDDDVTVLELAMEKCFEVSNDKKLKEILNNYPNSTDDVLSNVCPSSVTYLLADETLETAYVHSADKKSLTKTFIPQQNYTIQDINGNTVEFKEGNLYRPTSIIGSNESAKLVVLDSSSNKNITLNYDNFIKNVFAKNAEPASQKAEKLFDAFKENPDNNVLIFGAPKNSTVQGENGEKITLATDEPHAFIVSEIEGDDVTLLNSSRPTVSQTVSKDSLLGLDNFWVYGTEKEAELKSVQTRENKIAPKTGDDTNLDKAIKKESATFYSNIIDFFSKKFFNSI